MQQGMTQVELAQAMEIDRTAISKMEGGERKVDTFELAQLARVLQRSLSWFVTDPSPAVVSRRDGRQDAYRAEDLLLEELVQDVEQLVELGALEPPDLAPISIASVDEAETAAAKARRCAGLNDAEPVWGVVKVVERLGLYSFVLRGSEEATFDGSYLSLQRGGVALINGAVDSGRRRFTIAHELGHHMLDDEYSAEWVVPPGGSEAEKIINAFAVHFLLPRAGLRRRWEALLGAEAPRIAAVHLAIEYGVSWSALCAQLHRVGCFTVQQHEELKVQKPTSLELAEYGLQVRDDVSAPMVPPSYAVAVTKALRKGKLGPDRALELLRGTVLEVDLPGPSELSLEQMTAELAPLQG